MDGAQWGLWGGGGGGLVGGGGGGGGGGGEDVQAGAERSDALREERPGHRQRAWRIGGSPTKCGEAEREAVRPKGKKEVVALEEPSMAWSSSAFPSGHHAQEVVGRSRIRRLVAAPMAMASGSGGGGLAGFGGDRLPPWRQWLEGVGARRPWEVGRCAPAVRGG